MIPLEDNFGDIVSKAQRGLGVAGSVLAQRAGLTVEELNAAKAGGEMDEAVIGRIAGALGLGAEALVASARRTWRPREVGAVEGLGMFTTRFEEMTVNAYVVWEAGSGRAVAFDTGADCDGMVALVRERGLRVEAI